MMTVAALFVSSLTGAPPSQQPWPIGVGPRYMPPAAPAGVLVGRPVGRFRCASKSRKRFGVHVELFAHRRVVIVPAGIGLARPFDRRLGRVTPRGCSYPLRALEPTGVVEVQMGTSAILGDLFRIWGQPLGPHRLASFRSRDPVVAIVGGTRWRGDPRRIPLRRHAQIVLEIGGYVPPHPRYLFPGGL